jgi:hypothetical protein
MLLHGMQKSTGKERTVTVYKDHYQHRVVLIEIVFGSDRYTCTGNVTLTFGLHKRLHRQNGTCCLLEVVQTL